MSNHGMGFRKAKTELPAISKLFVPAFVARAGRFGAERTANRFRISVHHLLEKRVVFGFAAVSVVERRLALGGPEPERCRMIGLLLHHRALVPVKFSPIFLLPRSSHPLEREDLRGCSALLYYVPL